MTSTVSQALRYDTHARQMDHEVGSIRASTPTGLREFRGMLAEHPREEPLVDSFPREGTSKFER